MAASRPASRRPRGSGQSARWTLSGAAGSWAATRPPYISSATKGQKGAISSADRAQALVQGGERGARRRPGPRRPRWRPRPGRPRSGAARRARTSSRGRRRRPRAPGRRRSRRSPRAGPVTPSTVPSRRERIQRSIGRRASAPAPVARGSSRRAGPRR